ncbi:MAG: hypothetical protein CMB56_002015 [Methanobacteriota archaeon]|nr:MAG: hypothetical protein CMB56_002015 [Euryarchaeota archaeon]|tara:strand:+ start:8659 stop:9810 length:1152 start_codon:yes stop_codon:yes gene_type:complete
MNSKRCCDNSNVGLGAMIIFIASGIVACIILATMIRMVEVTAQTPEAIAKLATREVADKLIVHEIYVWDGFDNYGVILELSPASESKPVEDLYWILKCTDANDDYYSFWGDFTNDKLQAGGVHEFTPKQQVIPGLKAEFFSNEGMNSPGLVDLTNRLPDIVTVEDDINYPKIGGAWTTDRLGNLPWVNEFSLRATGYIEITIPGLYTFEVNADDGYQLWVDGQDIVDGINSANNGDIELDVGKIPIHIEYNENFGVAGLELWWESAPDQANIGRQIVPAERLFHDANMVDEFIGVGDGSAAGTSIGNPFASENWVSVEKLEPGVIYEISVDQDITGGPLTTKCGPSEMVNVDTKVELIFIVARGDSTSNEFRVHSDLAGTKLV